jgi:hypothetical protein
MWSVRSLSHWCFDSSGGLHHFDRGPRRSAVIGVPTVMYSYMLLDWSILWLDEYLFASLISGDVDRLTVNSYLVLSRRLLHTRLAIPFSGRVAIARRRFHEVNLSVWTCRPLSCVPTCLPGQVLYAPLMSGGVDRLNLNSYVLARRPLAWQLPLSLPGGGLGAKLSVSTCDYSILSTDADECRVWVWLLIPEIKLCMLLRRLSFRRLIMLWYISRRSIVVVSLVARIGH